MSFRRLVVSTLEPTLGSKIISASWSRERDHPCFLFSVFKSTDPRLCEDDRQTLNSSQSSE